jgi:hypothetical protein
MSAPGGRIHLSAPGGRIHLSAPGGRIHLSAPGARRLKRLVGWANSLRSAGAQVAQLVEHATENCSVGGSIPLLGTILGTS